MVWQQNPNGVDVLKRVRGRQGLDAGMVAPFVHHEDTFRRPLDQTARGANVVGHRLLDEDRLSRWEQLLDHRGMTRHRGRHHVAVNVLVKPGNVRRHACGLCIDRNMPRLGAVRDKEIIGVGVVHVHAP